MSVRGQRFAPWAPLVPGYAAAGCVACVAIPARNEAGTLARCLDALAEQVDLRGARLPNERMEVLLLLNNCTDDSAAVARAWQSRHPERLLHIIELTLAPEEAHVGTARRLLMDTAWCRMGRAQGGLVALLSTDADTQVAPDWVAQNLRALQRGADVVGGSVEVHAEEIRALPEGIQHCWRQDREYVRLVARLEDLLDPQEGDPWPRHLHHFGSSLACTPQAYAQAGGMPAVSPLEDEAFVDGVRHADLRLRHEPAVRVFTSARANGRTVIGLAGQFRMWGSLPSPEAHLVKSADFLQHRFRFLRRLRRVFATGDLGDLRLPSDWWRNTFREALATESTCPGFLGAVYCDILIAENFEGEQEEPIAKAISGLRRSIMKALGSQGSRSRDLGNAMAAPERVVDR